MRKDFTVEVVDEFPRDMLPRNGAEAARWTIVHGALQRADHARRIRNVVTAGSIGVSWLQTLAGAAWADFGLGASVAGGVWGACLFASLMTGTAAWSLRKHSRDCMTQYVVHARSRASRRSGR